MSHPTSMAKSLKKLMSSRVHEQVVVVAAEEDLNQCIARAHLGRKHSDSKRRPSRQGRDHITFADMTAPVQESDPEVSPPSTLLTFAMRNNA